MTDIHKEEGAVTFRHKRKQKEEESIAPILFQEMKQLPLCFLG